MYVGVDTRYDDNSAESVIKHVPGAVLHKVPEGIGEIGRVIYKYNVVERASVLKDDLSDFVKQNKEAIINSYRLRRDELLSETDWTQTEDCPLDIHEREEYKAYRKHLRDFPEIHDLFHRLLNFKHSLEVRTIELGGMISKGLSFNKYKLIFLDVIMRRKFQVALLLCFE